MEEIKLIIQCSDIHVRNTQRHEEYAEQLGIFIEKCRDLASAYRKEEVRIVVCGDLLHQKNNITPELFSLVSIFLRELSSIARVIVIAGNHDLIVNNTNKKDALTALFETANFDNVVFLDYILDFNSGYVYDENITWVVYSIYDDYMKPSFEEAKIEKPENKVIGLYHGMIVGASLDNGNVVDVGVDGDVFGGCDCVMAGDIHKRQELKRGDVRIVYSGSLIQQTFGETITNHGFVVWDANTLEHKYIDLESEYGLYKFSISNFEDIDNDEEKLMNY